MSTEAAYLLDQARGLLARDGGRFAGVWPRATAMLVRQALEESLRSFWRRFEQGAEEATLTSQLLCFPYYLNSDPELASRAFWTWHRLSRACHAHPYELAPGLLEIRQWIEEVEEITAEVDRLVG